MNRFLLLFLLPLLTFSQASFDQDLFARYESFKEETLRNRRFKHSDLQPLIEDLLEVEGFTITRLGNSIQGRDISMISVGQGDVDVLLWSQMHGDESTATMAIFDILNYLRENREILAGKFTPKAIFYLLSHKFRESDLAMCVGCIAMVDAVSSGVVYTRDPVHPEDGCLVFGNFAKSSIDQGKGRRVDRKLAAAAATCRRRVPPPKKTLHYALLQ